MKNTDIISKIESLNKSRIEISIMYEKLFGHNHAGIDEKFWRPINEAIIKRWSNSGLLFIKRAAWKIRDNRNKTNPKLNLSYALR